MGRVRSIALDGVARGQVLVRLALDSNAPITATRHAWAFAGLRWRGLRLGDDGKTAPNWTPTLTSQPHPLHANLLSRLSDQGAGLLEPEWPRCREADRLLGPRNQKALMEAGAGNIGKVQPVPSTLARQWGRANLPAAMGQQAGATLSDWLVRSRWPGVDKGASTQVGASADALLRLVPIALGGKPAAWTSSGRAADT